MENSDLKRGALILIKDDILVKRHEEFLRFVLDLPEHVVQPLLRSYYNGGTVATLIHGGLMEWRSQLGDKAKEGKLQQALKDCNFIRAAASLELHPSSSSTNEYVAFAPPSQSVAPGHKGVSGDLMALTLSDGTEPDLGPVWRTAVQGMRKVTGTKMFVKGPKANVEIGSEISESELSLMKLASKYNRNGFMEVLKGSIKDENVLELFQDAMECGNIDLIKDTLDYICRNGESVLRREELKTLRVDNLVEIIKQDDLSVDNEISVFEAVYKWGVAEAKRQGLDPMVQPALRKVVDKPLKYVRFPIMDKEEFAMKVATKNVLESDEVTALMVIFRVSDDKRSLLPERRFISTPRNAFRTFVARDTNTLIRILNETIPRLRMEKGNKKREFVIQLVGREYESSPQRRLVIMDSNIVLQGRGKEATVIHSRSSDDSFAVLQLGRERAKVHRITIQDMEIRREEQGPSPLFGIMGVYSYVSHLNVKNVLFTNCSLTSYRNHNTFQNLEFDGGGEGIRLHSDSSGGVPKEDKDSTIVENITLRNLWNGIIILGRQRSGVQISNVNCQFVGDGVAFYGSGGNVVRDIAFNCSSPDGNHRIIYKPMCAIKLLFGATGNDVQGLSMPGYSPVGTPDVMCLDAHVDARDNRVVVLGSQHVKYNNPNKGNNVVVFPGLMHTRR